MDMVKDISRYKIANPFINSTIGSNDIWNDDWGSEDISTINDNEFNQMIEDLEMVGHAGRNHKTIMRVMLGNSGAGKSHLFSRLRNRKKGAVFFILISNPPLHRGRLEPFIMSNIIKGLRKTARYKGYSFKFSQLEYILYTTLGRTNRFQGQFPEKIYEFWAHFDQERHKLLVTETIEQVGDLPEMDLDKKTLGIFLSLLDPSKKKLALDWLSGSETMSDQEYEFLGVNSPIGLSSTKKFLTILGYLSKNIYPIIIVFDQLDNLKAENFQELEPILIDINDHSPNYYCLIGLTRAKYEDFERSISTALKGRLNFGLELSTIQEPQKRRELIVNRLNSKMLVAARSFDNISDPYFPLSNSIIDELVDNGPVFPRTLLMDAERAYLSALSPAPIQAEKLGEKVYAEWQSHVTHFSGTLPDVDTVSISQRLIELFEIIHYQEKVEIENGPLDEGNAKFKGTDVILTATDKKLRLVGFDVQSTSSFPSLLKRLLDNPLPNTVLVRDGRMRVSGKTTQERLQIFKETNNCFHLSQIDIRDFHALGDLLANMREGDYADWKTEPEPTNENILAVLAELPDLMNKEIAMIFSRYVKTTIDETKPVKTTMGKITTVSTTEIPSGPAKRQTKPPKRPTQKINRLGQIMREIMVRERWLSFSRLYWRVHEKGHSGLTPIKFDSEIRELCSKGEIKLIPEQQSFPENYRIVVWNLEEADA